MVISRSPGGFPGPDDEAPDGPGGSARPGDPEVVARVAGGDVRALGVLYDRFGGAVYSLARYVCGDPAAAEEVTREVFLALRRDADRFDPVRGSVATWVLTTARDHAVEARRRAPGTERDTPGPAVGRADLTAEQRETLRLAYVGGFTGLEIARILGRPADVVLADAAEALALLRTDAGDPP